MAENLSSCLVIWRKTGSGERVIKSEIQFQKNYHFRDGNLYRGDHIVDTNMSSYVCLRDCNETGTCSLRQAKVDSSSYMPRWPFDVSTNAFNYLR